MHVVALIPFIRTIFFFVSQGPRASSAYGNGDVCILKNSSGESGITLSIIDAGRGIFSSASNQCTGACHDLKTFRNMFNKHLSDDLTGWEIFIISVMVSWVDENCIDELK